MGNIFKLKNGSILLSTEAPGGIYNASQLKKIASLCDGESVVVKATEDQRLALLVNPDKAAVIAAELKAIGLGIRHYQDGLHQPVSCVGEMCEDHEQDALGSALDVSAEIEGLKLSSPLKIGINGCAKCCVPCHTLDISIVGDSSGYRISLGGKNSQLPEMASFMAEGVPAGDLARLVKSIIEIYKAGAQEGESLQEFIDRDGSSKFVQALAPWSQDAADSGDPFAGGSAPSVPAAAPSEEADTAEEMPDLGAADEIEVAVDQVADGEMAVIADDNTIVHDQLSGLEGEDLVLEDTPLNPEELNQEREFEIAAESDSISMESLEEIPVSSDGAAGDEIEVSIDGGGVDSGPEISMQELELDDDLSQAAADLQEAPVAEVVAAAPAQNASDDLSEAAIDAGDALRAQESAGQVEAVGQSEDMLEAELSASIEAQKDLLANDTMESASEAGNEILEASNPSLDTSEFDDHEIISEVDQGDHGDHDDNDDEFDVNDHLPLSEVVSTSKLTSMKPAMATLTPKKSWSIAGFDMDENGCPVVTWTNGVAITITPAAVEVGSLAVGGHTIQLTKRDGGVNVEIDGVRMFIPVAA
jgi:hypothetical protein